MPLHRDEPPDYPEPPEWYLRLLDVLHEEPVPQKVDEAVRAAIDAWDEEQNKMVAIEPPRPVTLPPSLKTSNPNITQ